MAYKVDAIFGKSSANKNPTGGERNVLFLGGTHSVELFCTLIDEIRSDFNKTEPRSSNRQELLLTTSIYAYQPVQI